MYESTRIVVVGGGDAGREAAEGANVIEDASAEPGSDDAVDLSGPTEWLPDVGTLLESLDAATTHLWLLSSGAVPRPDALRALVDESLRVDAGIAGSKLVDLSDPDRLVSVGMATDVFGAPYTGLDEGEIDAGQYDVVRDVAAVDGSSMLIRRDLARGLRGPDRQLAPEAAAIDLCQRARIRGGRIVVVPSSEVMVPTRTRSDWREEAGQIRSIMKVYSPLTLLWALPLRFLVGLLEAVVAPFLGRWTLFRWIRAWAWNVVKLPSTIGSRLAARHNRVAGDEELFRYQLRGSADLRDIFADAGARLRARLPGDETVTLTDLGRDLGQPAFVVGVLALVFVGVATRTLWNGFPAVGYSLPLPDSASSLLGAYAGGWNPGGFGSIDPLPPFVALAGAVQTITFGNPDLAAGVLIAGAFLSGIWGMTRLLRTWGVEAVPGAVAGFILVAGPAARAIGAGTGLGTIVALGILPWALRVPLARWPKTRRSAIGRVAATAWVSALLGLASPLLLVVPFAALVLLAMLTPTMASPWRAAGVSLVGTALAIPVLLPWLGAADLLAYIAVGEAYWEPGIYLAVAAGVALLAAVISSPPRLAQVAGWGGVIAGVGGLLARTGDLGPGREVELAGIAMASLGSAIFCGVLFESIREVDLVKGWRRVLAGIGFVGAAAVALSAVLVFLPGRAGLPSDQLGDAMGFTAAINDTDTASSRVLLIGPEDTLPGESRTVMGAGYRVVSAPVPNLWEAWLPDDLSSADLALEDVLVQLVEGESFRAGELLSQFGIRWVIFMGESPLDTVLAGQLDLVPLEGLRRLTFASEAEVATRAMAADGTAWHRIDNHYVGDTATDTSVFIAEAANGRWSPDWSQDGWGNSLDGADGEIVFEPISSRRTEASIGLGLFVILVMLSLWGRRRR